MADMTMRSSERHKRVGIGALIWSAIVVMPFLMSTATAAAEGTDASVDETDLPYMVLPVADLGDRFSDYQVDPILSGFDRAEDLGAGELGGYSLYYVPISFDSLDEPYPVSAVELYTNADDASLELTDGFEEWRQEFEGEGGTVDTFDVPAMGDEAIGAALEVDEFRGVLVMFRTGRVLGASLLAGTDGVTDQQQAITIALALLERIKGVLSGAVPELPAVLPPDVDCNGVVNAIDATLVLQLTSRLVDALRCDFLADANGDDLVNSIDAALILQFDAGLIQAFPQTAFDR